MSTIVTRAGKGSPLTNAEVDTNFTNLNSDKAEKANNLSDLTNAANARSNLGLGPLSTVTVAPVTNGGTGATTLTGLVKGNGTSAFTAAVPGTDYTVPANTVPRDSATGAASIPTGTTAQRPGSPSYGDTRINSTLNQPEWWNGAAWVQVADTGSAVTLTGTQTLQNKTLDSTNNISGASGHLAGFRNLLINGDFRINQRGYVSGTNTTGSNQYTLDRWRIPVSGKNITFASYLNGNTVTIPSGNSIEQVIEGTNISGGTYVISWEGTATCEVNGVPIAKGGTFTLPANTNATIEFIVGTVSRAQVEAGSIATPFEHRPVGLELSLCQRYCWRSSFNVPVSGYTASSQPISSVYVKFPVTMRASPTILASESGGVNVNAPTRTANSDGFVWGALTPAAGYGYFLGTFIGADAEL